MPDERLYTQAELDAAVQREYENHRRPLLIIEKAIRHVGELAIAAADFIRNDWRKAPAEMPPMTARIANGSTETHGG